MSRAGVFVPGTIELINETPSVNGAGDITAVFTIGSSVASVMCGLTGDEDPVDCFSPG